MTVFQITFLEDILSVTSILCLILQSNRKDFAAVSRAVKSIIAILEDIQNSVKSIHLQNFKKADEIIQKQLKFVPLSLEPKEKSIKLTLVSTNEFHKKVIKPFITALQAC